MIDQGLPISPLDRDCVQAENLPKARQSLGCFDQSDQSDQKTGLILLDWKTSFDE